MCVSIPTVRVSVFLLYVCQYSYCTCVSILTVCVSVFLLYVCQYSYCTCVSILTVCVSVFFLYQCPAAQLVDPSRKPCRLRLWHDQLFAKPPHHGGVVAWHQDYSYWTRTKPMMHVTVHIALDDQTGARGGLQFVPGSHRWHREGMPLPITDASFGDIDSISLALTEEERASFSPVAGNLRAGEASFHHPLTIHRLSRQQVSLLYNYSSSQGY
ncbi:hypothetical protein GBAR_LOCUS12939 [Geodia barretti]|uniref:Uncharacterized protein n=1 Tax=Geodia barretti TaxID=519541 RepID=A0AA35S3I9_GEOBA|nr:hypothetical protein GBAR_LOCUS12939 [Geodia barretti]